MTDAVNKPARFTRLRALLFLLITLAIGVALIVAMTWFVIGSAARSQAVAIAEDIKVAEYVTLPDDEAYPAALALGQDGTLYTGSYQNGRLWSISSDGSVSEIEGSRERIGSVTGLDVAPDGALIILDRITALDAKGAIIWTYAEGQLSAIVEIPNDEQLGLLLPDDIAVDREGLIYISDRARGRVWRYTMHSDNLEVWWTSPSPGKHSVTGLAYHPAKNSMMITDSELDELYRVPASARDLGEARDQTYAIYSHAEGSDYGFDGIDVSPSGEIYLALLGWNRVARLDDGALVMLAKDFRGASDVVYDPARDRLFVSNWNQFSLGFGTRPQLPFALDVIDLSLERD